MKRTERILMGTTETRLSIAVRLRDAFTARLPRRPPDVRLVERPERFTRNDSGYHVLTDLPEDASPVTVAVDLGDQFLPERRVLDASDLGSPPAILNIDLLPAPAYRFPADATLVRGIVGEADDDGIVTPLSGVNVTVDTGADGDEGSGDDIGFTALGRSDGNGEYVLFFRGLTDKNVRPRYNDDEDEADRGRVVHVDGERPVLQAIHHETERETTAQVAVKAGGTTSRDIEF